MIDPTACITDRDVKFSDGISSSPWNRRQVLESNYIFIILEKTYITNRQIHIITLIYLTFWYFTFFVVQTKAYVRSLKLHAVHKWLYSNGRIQGDVRRFHTFHWRFFSCSIMSTISGSTSEMSALSCFGHCSTQQQPPSVKPSPLSTTLLEDHV